MMKTDINEVVKVGVVFGDQTQKIKPVWFVWKDRRYPIQEVTYTWKVAKGRGLFLYFSVSTAQGDLYELCYDTLTYQWRLEALEPCG